MSGKDLRAMRGSKVGMVFQEPMTSLNPSMLIGRQLDEGLALHRKLDAPARRALILDMLRSVGLRDPEGALTAYPHQFSGGMRQRIMLASVMLLKPALLLADEPTTALDAVVQRDVMELMVELTQANHTAVLLISHDLGMVARYCSRIVVMCQGDVVEQGKAEDILARPQHRVRPDRNALDSRELLGELLVHGRGGGEHVGADIGDSRHLQQALDGAVFAVGAVQHGKDHIDSAER